jgi:hypothetical protein
VDLNREWGCCVSDKGGSVRETGIPLSIVRYEIHLCDS